MFKKEGASSNFQDEERPLFVFMHENAGNLGLRLTYYQLLIESVGVNVLSMAYRGYSYSDPVSPNEEGLKKDADAILQLLSNIEGSSHPKLAKHINKDMIFA